MYSNDSRILHVNEVANVASTLVDEARHEGKNWRLRRIPAGRGNIFTVATSRARDLVTARKLIGASDVVHLHYATNGYLIWGSTPSVLHLHGSDIRKDWKRPLLKSVISASLRAADAVVYSTPDLYQWIEDMRPDATWIPNPVPRSFLEPVPGVTRSERIVFSSRWDETKGIELLLPLAQRLVEAGCEVVGLDWGTHREDARRVGVKLEPLMDHHEFKGFLAGAKVVVGQLKFPALSMTDFQTMALGIPLICSANSEQPPAYTVTCDDYAGLVPRDPEAIAELILDGSHPSDSVASQWVEDHHSPGVTVRACEDVYRRILA
ncbi:glycosyltransferase [Schaalia sp. ZJ1691]|uniref:glycosyltransferase n=1 Tax=Schaalia sp. ZJ1691 TaxID=2709404 RepID=UPI0013ED8E19|nr:glycosyltransferase [Schaalia sp. ZJ1691]